MDGHIFAKIITGNFHHAVIRTAPRPGCRSLAPGDDDALGAEQNVFRTMPGRDEGIEGINRSNSHHERSGPLAYFFHA